MDRSVRTLIALALAVTPLTLMSGTAVGTPSSKEVVVINDGGAPVPVVGTVAVENLPATQEVSGTVGIDPSSNTVQLAGEMLSVDDGRIPWQIIASGRLGAGVSGQCFSVPGLTRGATIILEQATVSSSPTDPGDLRITVGGHYDSGASFLHAIVAGLTTSGMHFDTQEIQAILTPSDLTGEAPSNRLLNLGYCATRSDTTSPVSFDLTVAGYEVVS